MAVVPTKSLNLEIEIISNGFLLIKDRNEESKGTTTFCKDVAELQEKTANVLKFWTRVKKAGDQ